MKTETTSEAIEAGVEAEIEAKRGEKIETERILVITVIVIEIVEATSIEEIVTVVTETGTEIERETAAIDIVSLGTGQSASLRKREDKETFN